MTCSSESNHRAVNNIDKKRAACTTFVWGLDQSSQIRTVVVDVCCKLSRCCFACDKFLVGLFFCSNSCWKIGNAFVTFS
ncbi:unnamed protein product [Arctia plantaginis]|uniref:Uncharacterized protein n=1 Tax=Arctia plantaginis TaxID=874455 RepID=A0A8S1B678_ARCPL|nr:unnamed protein product [Arctia plantaginis]CAB3253579.1 unnamed protein product [Arctia plantaginis]